MKKIGNVAGMTWIDENGYLPMNQITVTIVLIGISPKIGIEVFSELHFLSTALADPHFSTAFSDISTLFLKDTP
jgi:hypothetical protein